MKNIRTIIYEEINKYIITENIQSLAQLGTQLDRLLKQVRGIPTNNLSQSANQLLNDTVYFVLQIIYAINRCVQANSLNESYLGGLNLTSGWGINLPPEFGGNFWNYARRGFYDTKYRVKRFFNGRNYGTKNAANGQYGNNGQPNNTNTPTTVRSEKLSLLLKKSTQVYQNYKTGEAKYQIPQNAPQISQGMNNVFTKIGEINTQYNTLLQQLQQQQQQQNAQGQP